MQKNDFIVWYSEFCRNLSDISTCGKKKSGRFERYVDDIICTVKRDPNTLLNRPNFCKRTYNLLLKKPTRKGELLFKKEISVNQQREFTC